MILLSGILFLPFQYFLSIQFFLFVNCWQFLLLYSNTWPSHSDSGLKVLITTQFFPLFLPCPHTYSSTSLNILILSMK